MNDLGLLERMKRWFSGKGRGADAAPASAKRCTLGPAHGDSSLGLTGAGAAVAGIAAGSRHAQGRVTYPAPAEAGSTTNAAGSTTAEAGSTPAAAGMSGDSAFDAQPMTPEAHAAPLDPIDPEWMQSLEELPQRIAESVAESAAGTEALEQIGRELEGHRQTHRAIAGAVRRLPDMAAGQAELTRQTNAALDRQALVLESMLDGITGLRAAFKTVEESSRRHLRAIAQLEAGHRQVLFEYQTLLLATHTRLTRLAALGVILAAAALGGVGYAIYLVATMGQ